MTWQPIDTAPKDGARVQLYGTWPGADGPTVWPGHWDFGDEEWLCSVTDQPHLGPTVFKCLYIKTPTHWQPLPDPPEAA